MAASRVSGRVWSLVRITVPNGLKSVRIRGRKTQNNSLYSYFQREPLGFLMCRSACWHTEKKARFQTLSATQNGSTAFRFLRLAVLPLFYLFSSLSGFSVSATLSIMSTTTALSCAAFCDVMTGRPVSFSISCRT